MSGSATGPTLDWPAELSTQLSWHYENQVQPRLAGLTDEEYFWEPVAGCWSVRARGHGVATEVGSGAWVIDFAIPEPDPPPVTTIAWRLGHVLVGVLGDRNATYFGGPKVSYHTFDYPSTADAALGLLDQYYETWISGVRSLDDAALAARCREPGYETDSMAALVLHISREMIHHCAEIALLRDLYAARPPAERLSRG